jgi:hypothetical protein
MDKIHKTFFYKRDVDTKIEMSRNIKNLKVGDIITFYGKLYENKKYTKAVANTIIIYKILLISPDGVLIETSNKYMFDSGTVHFMGNIFASNFDIIDNVVNVYKVKSTVLAFIKGTKHYKNALGYNKYKITGHGLGEIIMDLEYIN